MRIDELRLIAFGPFTGTTLDLSRGREGFHIIYGPNEAGKSSSLRALRYVLYGMPVQFGDDFIHPYPKLRIGAAIRSSQGNVMEWVRRKGRENTLRGPDDKDIIDEMELKGFLGGVDGDQFSTMFGFGYEDLVKGGREIIQGGGNLGRLIFSAGSGIANLREVQNELRQAADQLFKSAGQNPIINKAVGRLDRIRKDLREAQLPSEQWIKHDESLQNAMMGKNRVEKELTRKNKEHSRLMRIHNALPFITRHGEVIHELAAYATTALLPEAFSETRQKLVTELTFAGKEKMSALGIIDSCKQAISRLEVYDVLMNHGDLVEETYQDLGSQRKAAKDRIALETSRSALRQEAREILLNLRNDLTLDEAEKLRIKKTETVRIQELGAQYERIVTRIQTAKDQLPEFIRGIAKVREELEHLEAPVSVDELQRALADGEEYAPLEKLMRTEQADLETLVSSLEIDLGKLGLKRLPFEKLEELQVPFMETIRLFSGHFDAVDKALDKSDEEWKNTDKTLKDIQRQIETLELEQEVPTEEDLHKARKKREQSWQILSKTLKNIPVSQEEAEAYLESAGQSAVMKAFEGDVREADAISDRLRREADRVANKARLLVDLKVHKDLFLQIEKELETVKAKKKEISREWFEIWMPSVIHPKSPREMESWVQDFQAVVKNAKEKRVRQTKVLQWQEDVETRRIKLIQCFRTFPGLPDPGQESLMNLIKQAQAVIKRQGELSDKRERLSHEKSMMEKELDLSTSRCNAGEQELEKWQEYWEIAVQPLGLESKSFPSQATVVMEELKSLFEKLKEAKILQQRIEGIDRDTEAFGQKVSGLVEVMAKDLAGHTPEEIVLELLNRLKRSRDSWSRKETLKKQADQAEKQLKKAEEERIKIEIHLKNLCEQAHCQNIHELGEAEKRSDRRRQLETELKNLNDQLRKLSGGASVDDFIQEVRSVDPDGMEGELKTLSDQIDQLSQEKSALDQTIGSERTELGKMDGSAKAADLAEEMQNLLGRLGNDVEQYARLTLADKVLARAIEQFRDKHQGPILIKASELFTRMTGNSFEGIRAEFEENGQPVLVGLRSGSKDIVRVEGMSEGTADQLFLALRLAALEAYVEKNEPLPFIVDDILIKFDDERAVASLKELAELSKKTQVIYFTHQRHMVELAEKNIHGSMLFQHTLNH
ncbi:MAG: AAA family ATPase [Proteobacteria bacterium]|nr:AAA family ATPase [Pseudomonadota bacterium]MBU4472441.1 AAA family ATPase [Pseudomonadota bacterium]MCG2751268.1 AAA family ATPase [Desulfobacteraceae bacterium]